MEKQFLFKDSEAASNQLFEARRILKPIERIKEWYEENELKFTFEELKKIASEKESNLRAYFYSKLQEQIGGSKLAKKALEKEITQEIDKIMKHISSSIGSVLRNYNIEKKDIDLNTCEFTQNLRTKLEEKNTYYIQNEDEAEIYRMQKEIAELGSELRNFIKEKYGVNNPLVYVEAIPGSFRFFKERLDNVIVEPDPAAIISLRKIAKGKQLREEHFHEAIKK